MQIKKSSIKKQLGNVSLYQTKHNDPGLVACRQAVRSTVKNLLIEEQQQ